METKLLKLRSMLKEAVSRKEKMLVDFYETVLFEMEINNAETNSSFDAILMSFIENRVKKINDGFKKKDSKWKEQEIYLLTLLSYSFLNAKINLSIEKNKVVIAEK